MATHRLHLDIPKGIEVANVDVDFTVKTDGVKSGTLKISKGGVDWLPANNSVNRYAMTWEQLAVMMERHGRVKKRRS